MPRTCGLGTRATTLGVDLQKRPVLQRSPPTIPGVVRSSRRCSRLQVLGAQGKARREDKGAVPNPRAPGTLVKEADMVHEMARRLGAFVLAGFAAASVIVQPGAVDAQVAVPSKPAIFHDATWYLRNSLTSGVATSTFRYGTGGDIPVMGDWDGDGHDTVGVVRATPGTGGVVRYTWYLRNSNTSGPATVTPFVYGRVEFVAVDQLGTIPVVGDWNGDGIDTAGVVLYDSDPAGPIQWHLRNSNTGGPADTVVTYSRGRDIPITGDWDGDGDDTIGVVRGTSWLLRNAVAGGSADISFQYGSSSFLELPVPGDWDGNGTYTPAVLRNRPPTEDAGGFEQWLFRNSNSSGPASGQIIFGSDAQTVDLPIEVIPRLSFK
jgi:hypothetical protein